MRSIRKYVVECTPAAVRVYRCYARDSHLLWERRPPPLRRPQRTATDGCCSKNGRRFRASDSRPLFSRGRLAGAVALDAAVGGHGASSPVAAAAVAVAS